MRATGLLLATIAAGCAADPSSGGRGDPGVDVARHEIRDLRTAIERFRRDRAGRLPAALGDLTTVRDVAGRPYLARVPADPWRRPYRYRVTDTGLGLYDLRSTGPDGLPGTSDDVVAENGS